MFLHMAAWTFSLFLVVKLQYLLQILKFHILGILFIRMQLKFEVHVWFSKVSFSI